MTQPRPTAAPPPRNIFVLSGGGARGAAHVGMLRGLLAGGVTPHALVGTSVGALNAAFLAQTPTPAHVDQLGDRWSQVHRSDIFPGNTLTKMNNLIRRRPYLHSPHNLRRIVEDWVPYRRLEDLPTPVRVVTTHLHSGRPQYHDSGDLTQLLLASTALPAIFPPVYLPDPAAGRPTPHVDGGVSDLVPLAGALGLNATHVYVLDVTLPPLVERPRSPLDVLVACLGVSMRLRGDVQFGHQVQVTHIRATDGTRTGLTDFSRTPELINAGEAAALEALAHGGLHTDTGHLKVRGRRIRIPGRR